MILLDSNVWLALTLSSHVHHAVARLWLDQQQQPLSIWFCRPTQMSYLRLLTTEAVLRPYQRKALTNTEALELFEAFMSDGRIGLRLDEPLGLEAEWRLFASRQTASAKLWMDAYLAAFCRSGGYTMVTTDGAFKQFEGLTVQILG